MASASTKANPLISTLPRILTWPRFGFRTICSGRLGFAPFTSMPEASAEELRPPLPGKKEVEIFTEEFEIGSRMITLETRNIARFANGAVGLKMDETRVLSTVTGPRGDVIRDFLPLTVDYQEKQSAQGVIPKTFMRREGAPTERELLCGRIIDRAIRPLFPPGFYHEMQVMASVLSSDGKQDPDAMAANATSAALMLSDIPWGGPIGVIRVGRIFGQFVVNPSMDELKTSDLNLVYACSMEKTLMIDVQAREVPEKDLIAALRVAHPEAVKYLEPQIRLASKAGKQKKEYRLYMVSEKTKEKIRNLAQAPIEAVFTDPSYEKFERGKALDEITQDVKKKLEEESDAEALEALSKAVDAVRKEVVRRRILAEGLRVDGRHLDEVRLLECQVGILPLIHGSSLFSRGETQVVGTVTLGAPDDAQHLNSLVGPRTKRFMLHYSFPPFCTNEPGKYGGLSRREVGHGALAEKALLAVLPAEDIFPYTIRINADVMASEGSTSMAAACAGSSLALMDAGVPLKAHVGGVSVDLVTDIDPLTSEIKDYRILTDILGLEDHVGDIDFKIAGTRDGVTAMQLDMKLPGIPLDIICECLEPARKGRLHILGHMENEINAPCSQDNRNSPRMEKTLQPNAYSWNSILKCYCKGQNYKETLNLFSRMFSSEKPDAFTITVVLKACSGLRALDFGRTIHGYVKKNKCIDSNLFIGSGLIEFYSKCGNVEDARCVFDEYKEPDVVFWTTMVTAYEQNGKAEEALLCFSRMVMLRRLKPDMITLVSVVSACAQLFDIKAGRSVHGFLIRMEFDGGLSLMNALLNFYSKSGFVKLAATLFMKMEEKDLVSWGSMISCYAHNGAANRALQLLSKMIVSGVQPNAVIILSTLQACEATGKLETGRQMHRLVVQKDLELDLLLSTALIDMYMACNSPDEAVHVFNRMPEKDPISWSSVISGFVHNGLAYKALNLFHHMLSSEIQPDGVLMVKILAACSELGIIQLACCLHGYLIRGGFHNNSFIGASLIESYAKCGSLSDAVEVFSGIKDRDLVVWSSMFAGYAVHGQGKASLGLFDKMIKNSKISPNNITFLSILSACSHAGLVEEGIKFFNMMVNDYQLTPESKHYSIMVDLLGRTGEMDQAMDIINQIPPPVGAHVWGALLGASRIHQNAEIAEVAAENLFQLDTGHAGYYILLSSVCAVDGKWDLAADIRNFVKEKQLKKVSGHSVI